MKNNKKTLHKNIIIKFIMLCVFITFFSGFQTINISAEKNNNFKPVINKVNYHNQFYAYDPYGIYDDYVVYNITGYNLTKKKQQNYEYYYTLDGTSPNKNSQKYYHSITLKPGKKYVLKVVAYNGDVKGKTVTKKIDLHNKKLTKAGKIFWKVYESKIKPNFTDYERACVVIDWMSKNIKYSSKDSDNAIVNGYGVCADYARSFQYLAQGMGVNCSLVEGKMKNDDFVHHMWNSIYIDGYYFEFEPQYKNLSLSTSMYYDFNGRIRQPKKGAKEFETIYTEFTITPILEELGYSTGVIGRFTNIKKLIYAEGCTEAGFGSYLDLSVKDKLEEVVLADSVTKVNSFMDAGKLKKINLENVKEIDNNAFSNCISLESVDLPQIKNIEMGTFSDCKSLKSIVIPNVEEIRDYAFSGCTSLSQVELPEGLSYIGNAAFGNSSIVNITIPGSVIEMGRSVFGKMLERVTWVENLNRSEIILESTFEGTSLIEITYPRNTVFYQSEMEFENCKTLKKVVFSDGIKEIPAEMFMDCTNLAEVVLPEGLKIIPEYTFYNCTSLTSINFPSSLTYIGEGAFENTGIVIAGNEESDIDDMDY